MSDSRQLKADSTSSQPNLWSESVVSRDNAEPRTPDIPTKSSHQETESRLLDAPAEIRNDISKRASDDGLSQIVDPRKVDQNRSPSFGLFGVSSQVRRETSFRERKDVPNCQNSHRSVVDCTLEEFCKRSTSSRHHYQFLDRKVNNLPLRRVKELEIYIKMPTRHCRTGEQILFRITWMEDDAYVNFEVLGWRLDPNGNGRNVPGDVPYTLEHLEKCATDFAQDLMLTRHAHVETYLSVKACVGFVYDLFGQDCCLQELLRLSESTSGGMAGSREQSQCQTACMLLPSSDGPSTKKPTHLAREPIEEAYLAMATRSIEPSSSRSKATESKFSKGRQPLNPRTQNSGR